MVFKSDLSLLDHSNSIFIALNRHLKTDSRRTKPKKQRNIIMSLGHSKGRRHGKKPGKGEIRVDMLAHVSQVAKFTRIHRRDLYRICDLLDLKA